MLKQWGESINDYTNKFYQLVVKNAHIKMEEQLMAIYLSGLW